MTPALATIVAALRAEGFTALADEITTHDHFAHRYVAMRFCYLKDCGADERVAEYDEGADKFVHRYEIERH